MNRPVLVCLIALALLAGVGCPPRHPPHTPKPFGTKDVNADPVVSQSDK